MLESMFSNQVEHPYKTKEFPISKEAHTDRLFKHLTFYEDDPNLKLRLSAVDHNRSKKANISSAQKNVTTNAISEDIMLNKFRVKSVLSQEDYGIIESYWVGDRHLTGNIATSHNQYRIKGVSDKNWKSDWVYSELRGNENELIVYNMLYDVLDVMLSTKDNQIEYLLDYIVSDAFKSNFEDILPEVYNTIDPDEMKRANINELLSIINNQMNSNPNEQKVTELGENLLVLADELKKEFNENVMASPDEFAQLYKVYNLIDQYQEKNTDFTELLLTIFLEDRYEKIVQKSNLEVLLQNDEEMGIYLNTSYEFDIKTELVTSVCDASFSDHFVSNMNDAVQLITDSDIFERLKYSTDESLGKFFRFAMNELYAPIAGIDRHLLEVERELLDTYEEEASDVVVDYTTITDEEQMRYDLLYDILEATIKGDLHPVTEHHTELIDSIIHILVDSRKKLLFTYDVEDILEIYLDLGESFRKTYSKAFLEPNEHKVSALIEEPVLNKLRDQSQSPNISYQTVIQENLLTDFGLHMRSFKEAYYSSLSEAQRFIPLLSLNKLKETKSTGIIESFAREKSLQEKDFEEMVHSYLKDIAIEENIKESYIVQEDKKFYSQDAFSQDEIYIKDWVSFAMKLLQIDTAHLYDINSYQLASDIKELAFSDSFESLETILNRYGQDHLLFSQTEYYHNLFKHYLSNTNKFPILEERILNLTHEMSDRFQMDGTENVKYTLGTISDSWPIGVFRLGVNTLSSEVSF